MWLALLKMLLLCGEGDTLWNATLSWDTPDPQLPRCFRKTVAILVPAAVLVTLAAPALFVSIRRRREKKCALYVYYTWTGQCTKM